MDPVIGKIREYVPTAQNFVVLLSLLLAVAATGCRCKSETNAKWCRGTLLAWAYLFRARDTMGGTRIPADLIWSYWR